MNGPERGVKRVVTGVLVKQLTHKVLHRNMKMEPFLTRAVRAGEVHELVTTVKKDGGDYQPGDCVPHVGFLGFVEITRAGIIEQGDVVWAGSQRLGIVQGFDACHFVGFHNHYNIILARPEGLATGSELELAIEDEIHFVAGSSTDDRQRSAASVAGVQAPQSVAVSCQESNSR